MKNTMKISIIIPIYNVEKYLNQCIESIINQTYKNLEIILVDDGSPDDCPKMCDEWAKKDNRIKVIHKLNGGVSSARNAGLDMATGEYIAFVDPDDCLELTMYEKLYKSAYENNSDLVVCKYNYMYEDGTKQKVEELNLTKLKEQNFYPYLITAGKKNVDDIICFFNINGFVWRCLFSKYIISKIRFKDFKICEDLVFFIDVLNNNPQISIVDEYLYHYLQRDNSACRSFNDRKLKDRLLSGECICERLKNKISEEEMKAYKFHLYAGLVNELLTANKQDKVNDYLDTDFGKSLNTKENYLCAKINANTFTYKVAYWFIRHKFFKLYQLVLKIKK